MPCRSPGGCPAVPLGDALPFPWARLMDNKQSGTISCHRYSIPCNIQREFCRQSPCHGRSSHHSYAQRPPPPETDVRHHPPDCFFSQRMGQGLETFRFRGHAHYFVSRGCRGIAGYAPRLQGLLIPFPMTPAQPAYSNAASHYAAGPYASSPQAQQHMAMTTQQPPSFDHVPGPAQGQSGPAMEFKPRPANGWPEESSQPVGQPQAQLPTWNQGQGQPPVGQPQGQTAYQPAQGQPQGQTAYQPAQGQPAGYQPGQTAELEWEGKMAIFKADPQSRHDYSGNLQIPASSIPAMVAYLQESAMAPDERGNVKIHLIGFKNVSKTGLSYIGGYCVPDRPLEAAQQQPDNIPAPF